MIVEVVDVEIELERHGGTANLNIRDARATVAIK